MDELTESMLSLSRVSRGEIEQEITDLSEMARGIVAGLRLSEPERRVDVTITSDLIVTGDRQLLKIALENLLENAWKFTGCCPVGRIEVGEMIKQDGVKVFLVRDNGSGFDMGEADKLFTPFHRLRNAQEFPGTGVGLATVQRIIQRHGGEIDGEGEPGKGATFYFTLGGDRTS
jgi:signal transduction histidine kinase